jgi:hypothetical protein
LLGDKNMTRRDKSFQERRQELTDALNILSKAIQDYEKSGQVYFLRVVASQLRALVVYEPKSGSLKHPLLIELAKEKGFLLAVYTIDQVAVKGIVNLLGPQLDFFSTGDALSLERFPPYLIEVNLEEALEEQHVIIGKEELSIKQVIRLVADTEASHYDPTRPEILDNLDQISIMGLSPEYRTIYNVGKITCDLSHKFIEATI